MLDQPAEDLASQLAANAAAQLTGTRGRPSHPRLYRPDTQGHYRRRRPLNHNSNFISKKLWMRYGQLVLGNDRGIFAISFFFFLFFSLFFSFFEDRTAPRQRGLSRKVVNKCKSYRSRKMLKIRPLSLS